MQAGDRVLIMDSSCPWHGKYGTVLRIVNELEVYVMPDNHPAKGGKRPLGVHFFIDHLKENPIEPVVDKEVHTCQSMRVPCAECGTLVMGDYLCHACRAKLDPDDSALSLSRL